MLGEYFQSGTQSPHATESGIFSAPPYSGVGAQPTRATTEGSLGPPVRGTGEYWKGGSMPPAGATREGIFNGPGGLRGVGEYWRGGGMPSAGATREGIFNGAVRGLGRAGALGITGGEVVGGVAVVVLLLAGAGGFVAGRAMAPTEQSKLGYSIAGTVAGLLLGPIGLGLLGGVALYTRKS